MRVRAHHYKTGAPVDIVCRDGVIASVGPPERMAADHEAGWVAPSFFDVQINGCDGRGFSSAHLTTADVRHVVGVCRRHGIGQLCPTLVTNSFAALSHGMATLHRACEQDPDVAAAVAGIHLEGPYIAAEDGPRGAHPRQHVRPPDWEEFRRLQDAAGGRIRLVTLAPEHEGALEFIEFLVAQGIVVALGHTGASGERIREAVRAGARLSTHLGNGSHAVLPRHDNYIWAQAAEDGLWASLICDGHHLPPSVVRCLVRAKTPERVLLTCDAGSLAGLPPGRYREWDQEFEVHPSGKIVVPGTGFLAGSWSFSDRCVGRVVRDAGVSLAQAVDMAGAHPRALMGLEPRSLETDQPADLVLFDVSTEGEVIVRATLVAGKFAPE